MKPFTQHLPETDTESFRYRHFHRDSFEFVWHHHPEYELTLIIKGSGRRFVGDNISDFKNGDLILAGPNLPHTWYSNKKVETIVVQFKESFLGKDFLSLPEMRKLKILFENSTYGLFFEEVVSKKIKKKLLQLEKTPPIKKVINLLEILEILSSTKNFAKLSTKNSKTIVNDNKQNRIEPICNYINDNYMRKITLDEISNIASMTPNSFCRFFKKATDKSFTEYVNDLRIGTASILLIETDLPISQVCYNAGFMNLSNFNRAFAKAKKRTPREYRKEFNRYG